MLTWVRHDRPGRRGGLSPGVLEITSPCHHRPLRSCRTGLIEGRRLIAAGRTMRGAGCVHRSRQPPTAGRTGCRESGVQQVLGDVRAGYRPGGADPAPRPRTDRRQRACAARPCTWPLARARARRSMAARSCGNREGVPTPPHMPTGAAEGSSARSARNRPTVVPVQARKARWKELVSA